jgi:hypothetical protein
VKYIINPKNHRCFILLAIAALLSGKDIMGGVHIYSMRHEVKKSYVSGNNITSSPNNEQVQLNTPAQNLTGNTQDSTKDPRHLDVTNPRKAADLLANPSLEETNHDGFNQNPTQLTKSHDAEKQDIPVLPPTPLPSKTPMDEGQQNALKKSGTVYEILAALRLTGPTTQKPTGLHTFTFVPKKALACAILAAAALILHTKFPGLQEFLWEYIDITYIADLLGIPVPRKQKEYWF